MTEKLLRCVAVAAIFAAVALVLASCEKKKEPVADAPPAIGPAGPAAPSEPVAQDKRIPPVVSSLNEIYEHALAAREADATVTAEDIKNAEKYVYGIAHFNYRTRPAHSYPSHFDEGGDRTVVPETVEGREYGDDAARLSDSLAALGTAALPAIVAGYRDATDIAVKEQLLASVRRLKKGVAVVDELLLWSLKFESNPAIRRAASGAVMARRDEAIVPGLVNVAMTAVSSQRKNAALSLIYFFQHPAVGQESGGMALSDEFLQLLREEFAKRGKMEETSAALCARVLAMQGDAEATEFLIKRLEETNDRMLASVILYFLGDRKIAAAAGPLAKMLATALQPISPVEVMWALGEVGSALPAEEKNVVVEPLVKMFDSPLISAAFAPEIRFALAATGGAEAVDALLARVEPGARVQPTVRLHCVYALVSILEKKNAPPESLRKIVDAALAAPLRVEEEAMQFAFIRLLGASAGVPESQKAGAVVAELLGALRSGRSEWLMSGAAEALGNFGLPMVVRDLTAELRKTESDEVRYYVIKALGVIGSADSVEPLLEAAMSGSATVVEACARSLAEMAANKKFDLARLYDEYALPTRTKPEKANLLRCLAQMPGEAADGLLLKVLQTEENSNLLLDAMRYLDARLGPGAKKMPGLEDALINIVGNGDRLLYPVALDLLRKSGSAKAVPAIIEAARRNIGDGLIRKVAFRALAALGGDESIRFVLGSVKGIAVKEMNEKANQELSGDAFDALNRFDRETLRKTLSGIIAEPPDEDMLFAALLGTIVLERDEFVAPLMKIMNDEKSSARARSGAIIALGFKKAGQALSALTKTVGAEDSDAAYSAAFALGELRELGGAQALIDRLRAEKLKGAPDEFLVALILQALRKISGKDRGEDPTAWQQWYNETARAASGGNRP